MSITSSITNSITSVFSGICSKNVSNEEVWLLTGGVWNDFGVWDDNAVWED